MDCPNLSIGNTNAVDKNDKQKEQDNEEQDVVYYDEKEKRLVIKDVSF